MTQAEPPLTDDEYRSLASFRHSLRRFLAFSEQAARAHGVAPSQHQLLLAIRGWAGEGAPSTSEVAELLQLKLHSVGELAERAADNGLVDRHADPGDARRSLLTVTALGEARLDALVHRRELRELRVELATVLEELA